MYLYIYICILKYVTFTGEHEASEKTIILVVHDAIFNIESCSLKVPVLRPYGMVYRNLVYLW